MSTRTLGESDWEDFVEKEVFPMITKSRNKFGMTSASLGATQNVACIFALVGDLGAGKTTFSKTFLKKLGVQQHVQSPTFSIINSYDITRSRNKFGMTSTSPRMTSTSVGTTDREFKKVFHIDVYRIEDMNELEVLRFDEILSNPEHIVLIEWADKIEAHIPQGAHWIHFEHDSMETRRVTINEIPKQVRDDKHFAQDDK